MLVLDFNCRAGALSISILLLFIARFSSASDDVPTFPHLESRFETLNITCEEDVQNLMNDWQLELDAFVGPGGEAPMSPPREKAMVGRFVWPLVERAGCPVAAPLVCQFQGLNVCCYLTTTCCSTILCCGALNTCCNSNPGLCCGPGTFCCNLQTVCTTSV